MNTYRIRFDGRKVGAIGIFYPIAATRQGENEEAAILALYDEYEHIMRPECQIVKGEQPAP